MWAERHPSEVLTSTAIALRRDQIQLCLNSKICLEARGFHLHLLHSPATKGAVACPFQSFGGRGRKGAALGPWLRLAEVELVRVLLTVPTEQFTTCTTWIPNIPQTVPGQIRQAKQLVSPSENDQVPLQDFIRFLPLAQLPRQEKIP